MKRFNESNKYLPSNIDSDTKMISVLPEWDNGFRFSHEFINEIKSDINIENRTIKLKKYWLDLLKKNPSLDLIKENKIIFIYDYNDKNWVKILEIILWPDEYKDLK